MRPRASGFKKMKDKKKITLERRQPVVGRMKPQNCFKHSAPLLNVDHKLF